FTRRRSLLKPGGGAAGGAKAGVPGTYAAGSSSRIGRQRPVRRGTEGSTTSSRARARNSRVCALALCSSSASWDAQISYPSTRVSSSGSNPTSKRTTPRSGRVASTSRSRASRISRWAPGLVVSSTTSSTCGEAGSVMAILLQSINYDVPSEYNEPAADEARTAEEPGPGPGDLVRRGPPARRARLRRHVAEISGARRWHHRAQPPAPVPEQGGAGRRGDRLA